MSPIHLSTRPAQPWSEVPLRSSLTTAIAIPARDEAARLPACLAALGAQQGAPGLPLDLRQVAVVVAANNCSDDTADIARSLAPSLPFPLFVQTITLPPARAHAGGARRAAMDTAASLFATDADAALLSTDADGRVAPNWLAANLAALAAGADAVAGAIEIDPDEAAALPKGLLAREAKEANYAALLDHLATLVDPDPHDPWPRHSAHSGASIALTLAAYRRVGGLPEVPVGEDRALFDALARADMKVGHCPFARVTVSCRLDGRAAGGMADTMRRRIAEEDAAPLDASLEPADDALARLRCRRRLRALRAGTARNGDAAHFARTVCLDPAELTAILQLPTFSQAWETLQAASSRLQRRRVVPAGTVETEIARATTILKELSGSITSFSPRGRRSTTCRAADPADTALSAPGG